MQLDSEFGCHELADDQQQRHWQRDGELQLHRQYGRQFARWSHHGGRPDADGDASGRTLHLFTFVVERERWVGVGQQQCEHDGGQRLQLDSEFGCHELADDQQ